MSYAINAIDENGAEKILVTYSQNDNTVTLIGKDMAKMLSLRGAKLFPHNVMDVMHIAITQFPEYKFIIEPVPDIESFKLDGIELTTLDIGNEITIDDNEWLVANKTDTTISFISTYIVGISPHYVAIDNRTDHILTGLVNGFSKSFCRLIRDNLTKDGIHIPFKEDLFGDTKWDIFKKCPDTISSAYPMIDSKCNKYHIKEKYKDVYHMVSHKGDLITLPDAHETAGIRLAFTISLCSDENFF